ncbi:MAG: Crp/Fnr family transcriptional regulator [Rhodobacteraceae bacterium]|nr:Crp/Fnr family transcriptional regulator [Paracoccaceae bacterium]
MPHEKNAASSVLTTHGWLSHQPSRFQHLVIAKATLRRATANEYVYVTGDPPGGIFGLVAGTLAVSIAPGETGPHLVHLAAPGWWFGEGCFLTGMPRRISLQAVTDCTLVALSLPEMNRLVSEDAEAMRRFAQIAMLNIDLALLAVEDLLRPDASRRIAAVLWRGAGGQSDYRLPVTQAELRQIANTSRKETLGALKRLDELGVIRRSYASIEVLDARRLRRFADGDEPVGTG